MRKYARERARLAVPDGQGGVTSPAVQDGPPPNPPASACLGNFAEELGRVLARRLLAVPDMRRGYSLPELLLGAVGLALLWLLIVRGLGLFPR